MGAALRHAGRRCGDARRRRSRRSTARRPGASSTSRTSSTPRPSCRRGSTPRALLDLCLDAERRLKRVRDERWGPRLIDIDMLVFGDRTIHEAGLDIPHPRMLERAFVLVPLAEIAPDLVMAGAAHRRASRAARPAGIERRSNPADGLVAA